MSEYPKKIDNSVSLPLVRNNIIEAGADTINKIREAVLAIESALGLDINGEKRNLSDRLSQSINPDGSLKQSALASLNIISGHIKNSDVSSDAKIEESKLDLEYSTKYLKSQILIAISDLERLNIAVSTLKSEIELHKNSVGAHAASSISVKDLTVENTSSYNLSSGSDLQTFLENFYSSHINPTTKATSSLRSHTASQVYVDPTNISGVYSENLQDAVQELSKRDIGTYENIVHNYVGSHYPKISVVGERHIIDSVVESNIQVSFSIYSLSSGLKGSFLTIINGEELNISIGDKVSISENKYVISEIVYSSGAKVEKVFAEGFFPENSQVIYVDFIRKIADRSNEFGFYAAKIKTKSSKNYPDAIQFVNPESATIFADYQPKFHAFGTSNSISVQTETSTYAISYSNYQSLDLIVMELNQYCIDNNIPLLFFQKDLSIGVSNMIISESSFIKIVDSDTPLKLGFTANKIEYSKTKRNIVVGRNEFKGLKILADSVPVSVSGDRIYITGSSFRAKKITKGSSLIINNKRYLVSDFFVDGSAKIEQSAGTFEGTMTCYDSSAMFDHFSGNIILGNPQGFESAILSVYMSEDQNIAFEKLVDVLVPYNNQQAVIDFALVGLETKKELVSIYLGIDSVSQDIYIRSDGGYDKFSSGTYYRYGNNNFFLKILDEASLRTILLSLGSSEFEIILSFSETSTADRLRILNVNYEKSSGAIRSVSYNKISGFVEEYDIGNSILEKEEFNTRMMHDTRVIDGFEILSSSVSEGVLFFNVSGGTILIDGRFVKKEDQKIYSKFSATGNLKAYIYSDKNGNLQIDLANQDCSFPMSNALFVPIALVDYYNSNIYHVNLSRYHVDHHRYSKNTIYVSDDSGGNSRSLKDALFLAKQYIDVYGHTIEKIQLSEGRYTTKYTLYNYSTKLQDAFSNGLIIDFPIKICGCGEKTIIDIDVLGAYSGGSSLTQRYNRIGSIFIYGPYSGTSLSSMFPNGSRVTTGDVVFENLKLTDSNLDLVGWGFSSGGQYNGLFCRFNNVVFESTHPTTAKNLVSCSGGLSFLGNLSFSGCKFINSNIYLESNTSSIYNLSIVGCDFYSVNGSTIYAIETESGTILNGPSDSYSKYNIVLSGNKSIMGNFQITEVDNTWFDYQSNTQKSSSYVGTETLISEKDLIVLNRANFNNATCDATSTTFNFYGSPTSTPIKIASTDAEGYAIDLSEGFIKGYHRQVFRNVYQDLVASTFRYKIFNFVNPYLSSSANWIVEDNEMRLFADSDIENGLVLRKITLSIPVIEDGDGVSVIWGAGDADYGQGAFSSGSSGALWPQFSGSTIESGAGVYDHLSSQTKKVIFSGAIPINKKSLSLWFGFALSQGSAIDPFKIIVDVEVGVKS